MTRFFRKLRWLVKRAAKESVLRDELQFHLDEETDDSRSRGCPRGRTGARLDLGNMSLAQEGTREPGHGYRSSNASELVG